MVWTINEINHNSWNVKGHAPTIICEYSAKKDGGICWPKLRSKYRSQTSDLVWSLQNESSLQKSLTISFRVEYRPICITSFALRLSVRSLRFLTLRRSGLLSRLDDGISKTQRALTPTYQFPNSPWRAFIFLLIQTSQGFWQNRSLFYQGAAD